MKLAEALNARKELEARLTRLEERLHASARVQEGLEPDESPDALYAMLEKAAAELVEIVSRISRTNVETVVEGRILADWIAERDVSWRRLRVLQSALRAAGVLSARIRTMYPKEESLMCWHLVNPLRPIINWTGLPCLLPARTAWAQIASKLRNLRSHGTQLRANPN